VSRLSGAPPSRSDARPGEGLALIITQNMAVGSHGCRWVRVPKLPLRNENASGSQQHGSEMMTKPVKPDAFPFGLNSKLIQNQVKHQLHYFVAVKRTTAPVDKKTSASVRESWVGS
jgi:hypothetical protein